MTTAELHEILDDENRKLTADELKEVVYQLKQDCWEEYHKENSKDDANNYKLANYTGVVVIRRSSEIFMRERIIPKLRTLMAP